MCSDHCTDCRFVCTNAVADDDTNENVANLESQLADLRADNDARYKNLTTSTDLEHIKKVAMKKLGMKYPTEKQVVYYTVENSNFMDQYEDIPSK